MAPPAALTASATRDPAGSCRTPGCRTRPTTCTTTTPTDGDAPGDAAGAAPADGVPEVPLTPTGTAPADTALGPARDPPPGAMTVPLSADRAQATRSPKTAAASATTMTTPTSAARPGCQRAPTNAAGSRTHPRGCGTRACRAPPGSSAGPRTAAALAPEPAPTPSTADLAATVEPAVTHWSDRSPDDPASVRVPRPSAPRRRVDGLEVELGRHVRPRARPQPGQRSRRERFRRVTSRHPPTLGNARARLSAAPESVDDPAGGPTCGRRATAWRLTG